MNRILVLALFAVSALSESPMTDEEAPPPQAPELEGNPLLDIGLRDPCVIAALGAYQGAIQDVASGIKAAETEALAANNAQKDIILQARDQYEAAKLAYKSELEGIGPLLESARESYKTQIKFCLDREDPEGCFAETKEALDTTVADAKTQREEAKAILEEAFQIKNETTSLARQAMTELQSAFFSQIREFSLSRKEAQDTLKQARIDCKVEAIKEEQPVLE